MGNYYSGNSITIDAVLTYIAELSQSAKGTQYIRGFMTSWKGTEEKKTQIFNTAFSAFGEVAQTIALMSKGQPIKCYGHMESSVPRQQQNSGDQKEYITFIIDGFSDQRGMKSPEKKNQYQTTPPKKPDAFEDLF
jgi:hypothetical protein